MHDFPRSHRGRAAVQQGPGQTRSATLVALLVLLALSLALPTAASAQATRTYVSGVGNDVNPCSRTAPCKTFAGAYSKTAEKGEINVLDPGGYGAVTLFKSITIDGHGHIAGVLTSAASGITVNADATDKVTLRDLRFNGLGTATNGVRVIKAGTVRIQDSRIIGFVDGVLVEPQTAPKTRVYIRDTSIHLNRGYGVRLEPREAGEAHVTLTRVDIEDNFNGVNANGFYQPANVNIFHSSIANNGGDGGTGYGLQSTGAMGIIRIGDTDVINNTFGLRTSSSGQIRSFGDNYVEGNGTDGAPTATIGKV